MKRISFLNEAAMASALSVAKRSYPMSEARGNGLEEPPHVRGQGRWPGRATHIQEAVAVLVQEGLEELSHVEGQEGWR